MKGNKEVINNYMKDNQVYICVKEESKEGRTIQQNATLHKIIEAIRQFKSWSMEDAKKYTLVFTFWYESVEYMWEVILVPQHTSTAKLKKVEAIKYIDFLIEYCKENDIWVVITPREITSLYESFNN